LAPSSRSTISATPLPDVTGKRMRVPASQPAVVRQRRGEGRDEELDMETARFGAGDGEIGRLAKGTKSKSVRCSIVRNHVLVKMPVFRVCLGFAAAVYVLG
jgi:hypothetical protein